MTVVVGKLFWLIAKPSNLIALALLLGVVTLWSGWHRLGIALATLAALPLVLMTVLPLGSWLLIPLEGRFPAPEAWPDAVDGVIVLGGAERLEITAVRGQPTLGDSAERLLALVELGRRYPDARLVFTGGAAVLAGGSITAADVAREALRRQGFDPARVVFEDRARDTHENAVLTRALIDPRPGGRWLLVTSASHMPRAVGAFRRAGWPVIAFPVDYRTTGRRELEWGSDAGVGHALADLDDAAHGWVGLVAYRLLGRTDALFPAP